MGLMINALQNELAGLDDRTFRWVLQKLYPHMRLGTVGARRALKTPPSAGGWSMFHTSHGGEDCASPANYIALRANRDREWFGWPNIPVVEKEIAKVPCPDH
jgi:hypothetical protein